MTASMRRTTQQPVQVDVSFHQFALILGRDSTFCIVS